MQHAHNLVDSCFEEGEYEAGIELLGQLRAPKAKPASSHIRQLLYIALLSDDDRHARIDISASPTKRQRKASQLPSPAASLAAQALLVSFVATNAPADVIRPLRPAEDDSSGETVGFLATESLCISRSRNCWQILAGGFLLDQQIVQSRGRNSLHSAPSFGDLSDASARPIVGETAWPILDWLLSIFERDEAAADKELRHSSLMLEQLGTASRRDTDTPLAIFRYCLKQTEPRRRALGSRMLNLLINLCSATELDFPLMVVSVFNIVSGSSSEDIASLLSSLRPSSAVSKFKIALYQRYFSETSTKTTARPRPQARAQPRGSPVRPKAPSLINKYRVPSTADFLRLLAGPAASTSAASGLRIKYDIVVSYNDFQVQATPAERDPQWQDVLRDGTAAKTLDEVFGSKEAGGGEGIEYREMLETILSLSVP